MRSLATGPWEAGGAAEADVHHHGFLIVDGLLSREVDVLGRRCVELLGPGDVLRPWMWDLDGAHVQAEVGWVVLEPTRLAVLDHRLVLRINPWPQLGLELFARGTRRAHALAVSLAIAHHPRVEDRLLLTLWYLGERWGKVGTGGIAVPLPLPHQRLADLVGAHRPSVTAAMGELAKADLISRRADGAGCSTAPRPRSSVSAGWRCPASDGITAGGRRTVRAPAARTPRQRAVPRRPLKKATRARIAIRNRSGWMMTPPAMAMHSKTIASMRSMVTSFVFPSAFFPICVGVHPFGTGHVCASYLRVPTSRD